MEKTCNKCNSLKLLTEFTKAKKSANGYTNTCKVCMNKYCQIHRLNNLESTAETHKKYRENNPEKIKNYRDENKNSAETIQYRKKWYDDNKEYYQNREKTEEHKEYRRNYNKTILHVKAWRTLLSNSLFRIGKPKEGHTIDLLGYSALQLKEHLESLFTDGMSWDNHGEWHIDHKTPVSKFDKETPMNIVNSLSNLQPLWATTREINGIIYEGNLNKHNN